MFSSTADVFRTRQALADLNEVVQRHREAIVRPGFTGAERDAIEKVLARNGRFTTTDDSRVYPEIRLAAAIPDEDFGRFVGATALLLSDRLQQGCGGDDLYWNWDAFQDHYMLADPPVRAALMNGFRIGDRLGRVSIETLPSERACLTLARGDVIASLNAGGEAELARAVANAISPEEAGELWRAVAEEGGASWTQLAGFRYLYERGTSMTPADPETVALIPWAGA